MSEEPVMDKIDKRVKSLAMLLAGVAFASSALVLPDKTAFAQSAVQASPGAGNGASLHKERKVSPYRPVKLTTGAKNYYGVAWGIENMLVRRTASGSLIRFSYRVTDPVRAKAVSDDHSTPYLFDQRSNALLHIPVMENVGKLRQAETPEAGKEYWMVFSNKGNYVKAGDRVNVIIGTFYADGLTVE